MTRTLHHLAAVAASLLALSCASPPEHTIKDPPPAGEPPTSIQGPPGKRRAVGCFSKWQPHEIWMRLAGGAKYHVKWPKHVIGGWVSHSSGKIETCVQNPGDALIDGVDTRCDPVSPNMNHGADWIIRYWGRCVVNPHWDADGDGWGPDKLNNPPPECLAEADEVTPTDYHGWKESAIKGWLDCNDDGDADGYYCVNVYSSGGLDGGHKHLGHIANSYCYFAGDPAGETVVPYKACDVHPSQKFKVEKGADPIKGDAIVFGLGYNANHTDAVGGMTLNFAVGWKGLGAFWTDSPKADGGRWWHARNFSAQLYCSPSGYEYREEVKRGLDPADGGDETLTFDGERR